MADLSTLLAQLQANQSLARIVRNPAAQFGVTGRRYLGATLLPEQLREENAYEEQQFVYRAIIANAGTRYSPTQKKRGLLVSGLKIFLAESDIADEFTAEHYDALLRLIEQRADMQAVAALVRWFDNAVNIPLTEWRERARWQAIVNASVQLRGDNEYTENIAYPNPTGHRVAAGGAWSNDGYDPFADIFALADFMAAKGKPAVRAVASRNIVSILGNNALVAGRVSPQVRIAGGTINATAGRATLDAINNQLVSDGLPPIELYDLQYRTNTTTGRFLPNNVFCLFGQTGVDAEIDLGDVAPEPLNLQNVIGYLGIGRAAGQATPGPVMRAQAFENKPPRIEAEGWQTALPVIQDSEALGVITGIA
jgi:hypothetical protein